MFVRCTSFLDEIFQKHHLILPEQIEIDRSGIPREKLGVFSTMWIKEGTQMGPFTGRFVKVSKFNTEDKNDHSWEVGCLSLAKFKSTDALNFNSFDLYVAADGMPWYYVAAQGWWVMILLHISPHTQYEERTKE